MMGGSASESAYRVLMGVLESRTGQTLSPNRIWRIEMSLKPVMQRHGIGLVVTKNAGGHGAEAKLIAARELGLPVVMIDRPALPARHVVARVAEVMDWLHGAADRGV